MDAETLKQMLGLRPLPSEGGFFAEVYRSDEKIAQAGLPDRYLGERSLSTAIYYLLTPDSFSAMHKLASDELYHFYLGDPVECLLLREDGSGEIVVLGADLDAGMRPLAIFPRGAWQGSRLRRGGRFALLGTTVAPGFEFADFELGARDVLLANYPRFSEKVLQLTR